MLIRANNDGTYSANWTPGTVGLYTIHVTIDGIETGELTELHFILEHSKMYVLFRICQIFLS